MSSLRTAFAIAFIVAISLSATADAQTTRYVDIASCPGPGSGTEADPFCKIQDGIDAADDGDTVLVAEAERRMPLPFPQYHFEGESSCTTDEHRRWHGHWVLGRYWPA